MKRIQLPKLHDYSNFKLFKHSSRQKLAGLAAFNYFQKSQETYEYLKLARDLNTQYAREMNNFAGPQILPQNPVQAIQQQTQSPNLLADALNWRGRVTQSQPAASPNLLADALNWRGRVTQTQPKRRSQSQSSGASYESMQRKIAKIQNSQPSQSQSGYSNSFATPRVRNSLRTQPRSPLPRAATPRTAPRAAAPQPIMPQWAKMIGMRPLSQQPTRNIPSGEPQSFSQFQRAMTDSYVSDGAKSRSDSTIPFNSQRSTPGASVILSALSSRSESQVVRPQRQTWTDEWEASGLPLDEWRRRQKAPLPVDLSDLKPLYRSIHDSATFKAALAKSGLPIRLFVSGFNRWKKKH